MKQWEIILSDNFIHLTHGTTHGRWEISEPLTPGSTYIKLRGISNLHQVGQEDKISDRKI